MPSPTRTVWIADDSRLDAERARDILAPHYAIELFSDGSQVLERISEGATPDVLVLDWVMPGIGGLEVTRFIRSQPGGASTIAILLLTAMRASDQIAEGMAAGANDYLSKPYPDDELRARVATLITSKRILESVAEADDRVRRLLVHAPDALVFVDAHGKISYANAEGERVLGLPAVALAGRPLAEVAPALQLALVARGKDPLTLLADVEINGEVFAPTVRFLPSDFAATTSIALRNVTERRRLESRRLDFYSIIAHDLRSPLSAVLLRTELILRGGRGILPAELINDVRRIDVNIRSMVALINDFLDLARLEGGGYRLDTEQVDVGALVAQTVDDIRPLAEESRLRLRLAAPPARSEPLSLHADRRRLVQVLTNLLSNAIKFTSPGGTITVGAARRGGEIEITVADTGRGIPAHVVPTLFQRYTRAPERHAPTGGTGLGLMIVREIVEAHGGTVEVSSRVAEGSTFVVRLPVAAAGRTAVANASVLVVDDDIDIRDSLQFVLEKAGYNVHTAEHGREALDKLADGFTPRVVVLDVSMPVMTGPELLAAMQQDARLARLPVVVMSGNLAALGTAPPGALVLQKPIQVDRLLDYLVNLSPPARATAGV
jgi:signal transduction histidine kinase